MQESSKLKSFLFVTSNMHKFREASEVLEEYRVRLKMARLKKHEVQDDSLRKIAVFSALEAYAILQRALLVEDTGLFVDSLKGFPGPYSEYICRTIQPIGVVQLLEGASSRKAFFKSVLACVDENGSVKVFTGTISGVISKSLRGGEGFGFDPIFIPSGSERTFAEMSVREKNRFSHRAKAFRSFAEYLVRQRGED